MVPIDCHPLSVVEDVDFRCVLNALEPRYSCPSRKYYTDTIIPKIFSGMKDEVGKLINSEEGSISFTTDIWSCSVNDTSLLSLTAHWINNSFEKQSAVLHAQSLEMAHTDEYIASCISTMLDKWDISRDLVHLVLSDNASNMVKAMQDASLPHFGCFVHSLQLVKDGLLSQWAIADITAVCKNIVGHFHRSSIASHNLTRIQQSLGIPQHKLKQEVATRWNSTLYMYQSVLEQKMTLAAYSAENGSIQQLSAHQLGLVKKCVDILSPIEEVTRSISAKLASISIVIPYIRVLTRTLEKNEDDGGVRTMKGQILHSLKSHFAGIEEKEQLALATMLDP
ncbi:zinc finger BED domain-containing protein 4-like [Dysidea avara]|uniref:zinc finger BED domain-containing protein 4-like n=1 Tax=Dysidea avara TaxID=196820 RepID=UPI0033238A9D